MLGQLHQLLIATWAPSSGHLRRLFGERARRAVVVVDNQLCYVGFRDVLSVGTVYELDLISKGTVGV